MSKEKLTIKPGTEAKVLAALYNNSKPLGLGMLHYVPEDMTETEAEELLKEIKYFDYLKGRVMKVAIGPEIVVRSYDRNNGQGAALRVLEKLDLVIQ